MSGERCSVWDDPRVKAAIDDGRSLDDIAVLNCPKCGLIGYYNQGSHFTCRHCRDSWYVATEDEDTDMELPTIRLDVQLTMQDVLESECEDYP